MVKPLLLSCLFCGFSWNLLAQTGGIHLMNEKDATLDFRMGQEAGGNFAFEVELTTDYRDQNGKPVTIFMRKGGAPEILDKLSVKYGINTPSIFSKRIPWEPSLQTSTFKVILTADKSNLPAKNGYFYILAAATTTTTPFDTIPLRLIFTEEPTGAPSFVLWHNEKTSAPILLRTLTLKKGEKRALNIQVKNVGTSLGRLNPVLAGVEPGNGIITISPNYEDSPLEVGGIRSIPLIVQAKEELGAQSFHRMNLILGKNTLASPLEISLAIGIDIEGDAHFLLWASVILGLAGLAALFSSTRKTQEPIQAEPMDDYDELPETESRPIYQPEEDSPAIPIVAEPPIVEESILAMELSAESFSKEDSVETLQKDIQRLRQGEQTLRKERLEFESRFHHAQKKYHELEEQLKKQHHQLTQQTDQVRRLTDQLTKAAESNQTLNRALTEKDQALHKVNTVPKEEVALLAAKVYSILDSIETSHDSLTLLLNIHPPLDAYLKWILEKFRERAGKFLKLRKEWVQEISNNQISSTNRFYKMQKDGNVDDMKLFPSFVSSYLYDEVVNPYLVMVEELYHLSKFQLGEIDIVILENIHDYAKKRRTVVREALSSWVGMEIQKDELLSPYTVEKEGICELASQNELTPQYRKLPVKDRMIWEIQRFGYRLADGSREKATVIKS